MTTLEDRAFGAEETEDEPCAAAAAVGGGWANCAAAYMLPITVTAIVVAVVLYSLGKGMEYRDLFGGQPRYRTALFVVNALVVVGGTALVAHGVRDADRRRCA